MNSCKAIGTTTKRGRFSNNLTLQDCIFWSNWISAQQQLLHQEENSSDADKSSAYCNIIERPTSVVSINSPLSNMKLQVICGQNSIPGNIVIPIIELVGREESALCFISCVTKDPPYRSHPCSLSGRNDCNKGVCAVELKAGYAVALTNLVIKFPKIKDMERALKLREQINIDPFRTGFSHRSNLSSFDHQAVRLCFQTVLVDQQRNFKEQLTPILSDPIENSNRKSSIPVIDRLSNDSGLAVGRDHRILLCDEVVPEDITIKFYELQNNVVTWEAYGEFQRDDVHGCGMCSITFKTPPYYYIYITEPVTVFIQLKRPSSGVVSEPIQFKYTPSYKCFAQFEFNQFTI